MAKLSKKAVLELMDEFRSVTEAITKAEAAAAKALEPLMEAHEAACRPIKEKLEQKTLPLADRRTEIKNEIFGYLEQQGKDQVLRSPGGVVAEQKTETKVGSRVIDVEKFLKAAKSKGAAMWSCVTVAIAKAEKLLGKELIDEISTKKETVETNRTLRLEPAETKK